MPITAKELLKMSPDAARDTLINELKEQGNLAKKEPLNECAGELLGSHLFGVSAAVAAKQCPHFSNFLQAAKLAFLPLLDGLPGSAAKPKPAP